MTKFYIFLTAIILGCFSSSYAQSEHSYAKQTEQQVNTEIVLTSKTSPSKDEVIKDLLTLQSSLSIPLQNPIPKKYVQSGYLLIPMTPEYIQNLLEKKDGIIVGAYQEQILVGYILLTSISEFKELYQEESIGFIETSIDSQTLETMLSRPNVGYIEQIGVSQNLSRKGIGTQLVNACNKLKPDGLVADVFIAPLINEASLHFFSHQGFEKSGILYQNPRSNFPFEHRTQVLFWNLFP